MINAYKPKTLDEAKARYGEIIDGKWADESKHMCVFTVPAYAQYIVNSATGKPLNHIYCNKDFVEPLSTLFMVLNDKSLLKEIVSFDGCFMIRAVRGEPDNLSTHCYGIAVDINAKTNPLGGPVAFSQEFLQVARDLGFSVGADFKRVDGMHLSWAWE